MHVKGEMKVLFIDAISNPWNIKFTPDILLSKEKRQSKNTAPYGVPLLSTKYAIYIKRDRIFLGPNY